MTVRTDYLAALTTAGYTPSRAVLCEENTGAPSEFYTSVALTPSGSPTWSSASGYVARRYSATTDNDQLAGSPATYLGATKQTVLFARKKLDTSPRNAFAFGNTDTADATRFGAYLPFTDNSVYFYRGALGGANISYAAGTPTTNVECWGFVTGPAGSSVWKDGVKVASNLTARSWTLTATAAYINKGNSVNGDIVDVFGLILISDEVSDAVMATWTAATYLTGNAPTITSPTSLVSGIEGIAYSQVFAATGGTPSYTWAASGGPTGITMNASNGVYSGTPTQVGLFHIVITVTDSLDHSSQGTFDLYIDDPLCIPQAVASLARGRFTNNSRVGPHQDEGKKIAIILRDADNAKQLNANYSIDNGATWSSVKTSPLTNNIVSHDSHKVANDSTVHVWTQESTTGKVAYHTFSLSTGLWTLEYQQVSPTETILVGAVSGTVLSPSGDPAVVYESTAENVSSTNRNRMIYRRRTGGVWSVALPIGDVGAAQSDLFGRLISGDSDRATMFMAVTPGYSVVSTPDYQLQVIRGNGSLSSISVFRATGLLGTVPSFFLGDYTTYSNGTDTILVVPVKFGGEPTIFSFIDSDTPATASLGEPVLDDFVAEGSFVPIAVRWAENQLHFIDWGWIGSTSFLRHKVSTSALGPFTPSGMADQAGPAMDNIVTTTQTADANVVVRTCQGVDSVYIATVVPIGSIGSVTENIKFEWLKVDDLPTNSALTLAEWLTNLETQTITFCCPAETPESIENCECEAHPGRIYRMSMDLYSDDGCTIRRLRRTPHISEEQIRIIHNLLQVDVQAGQGLDTGQGSDPMIMLRFSDDGGVTWSNERRESAGKRGEFKKRVMFRRLGQSRDRVYELVVTDPVKWALVSGYLEVEAGIR